MKPQQQIAFQTQDQRANAPTALPEELLRHVSGGLPYHGFGLPAEVTVQSADSTVEPLPYHGF
jgi:hypothetical protein